MLTYILFVIGFALLYKGADFLVEGASRIAKILNISDIAIGLTIVAFGTSVPELFVNVFASVEGNTEIAISNVLGSNIANILLILGIASVICPLTVASATVWKEIPFTLLAAAILLVLASDRLLDKAGISALTRIDGIVLLSFFIIFMYYVFGMMKSGAVESAHPKESGPIAATVKVIIGFAFLALGASWTVNGAIKIATALGVSQSLIGLTIVAIGTSLPELATSAVAAYKKNLDIAIGNIVGSNIFNTFLILGVSSTIIPQPFTLTSSIDAGMNIIASVLLFATMFTGKKRSLDRWEGALFVLLYAGYMAYRIYQR